VTDPPDRAAELARSQASVEDVQMFGERIHVRLNPDAPPGALNRLRQAFVDAGVRDFTLRPIPTSLEDVFIARIGTTTAATGSERGQSSDRTSPSAT
jgi:hypothetical protein